MSFKPQQRHLTIRGRAFHFVSYEGNPPHLRRADVPGPSMWYIIVEGRRFPSLPYLPEQPMAEVDLALERWVEENGLAPTETAPAKADASRQPRRRCDNWWGPD